MSMPNETMQPINFETRCQRVLQFARDLYRQSPDWIRFFREVVGVDGAARKVFSSQQDYIAFERSDAFHTIQRMVNALRNNKATASSNHEPTRVITVRLPESLHEALKAEANDHSTSMNKLCIAKLLQVLEENEATQKASKPAPAPTVRFDQNNVNRQYSQPAVAGHYANQPVQPRPPQQQVRPGQGQQPAPQPTSSPLGSTPRPASPQQPSPLQARPPQQQSPLQARPPQQPLGTPQQQPTPQTPPYRPQNNNF